MRFAPLAAALLLAAPLACTDDNVKPQEPVAPVADTSVYGEDPQLAPPPDKPDAETGVPNPEDYDADTGALTNDPFGAPKNVPKMHDKSDDSLKDVPQTPPDQLNIPPENLDAAAQSGQAPVGRMQKAVPTVPGEPSQATPAGRRGKSGAARSFYVVPKMLNVRSAPNPKSKVVRTLKGGEKVTCVMQGNYCVIKSGEFVRANQLTDKAPKSSPKRGKK